MADPNQIKALAAAIELLRRQIADLPAAILNTAGKTPEQLADEAHARGQSAYDAMGFGRDEGFGGDRLRSGAGNVDAGPGVREFVGALREAGRNGLAKLTGSAVALGVSFTRLLGPLSSWTTFLTSSTSGFQVFSQAMQLFVASVAPVFMPAFFLLAVGLAAASDAIWKRLAPALDSFYKLVLQSGIPAMRAFADMVGRATSALASLADTKVGRLVAGGDGRGGRLGALDRLTGGESGVEMDASGGFSDKAVAYGKRLQRGAADLLTTAMPFGGETASRGVFALNKSIFGEDADPYSGRGVRRTGEPGGADETRKALGDTLRQMILSMGPKPSVGSAASVYSRAQQAALGQTPFERRMLEMMQTVTQTLTRSATPTPGESVARGADRAGGE